MEVKPGIFKAYDIRGIYPDELDEEIAYRVGSAFVRLLSPKQVIIGRDMRLSGEALMGRLIDGILDQGADVLGIGMVSTDQYYFACATRGLPGIMVTASHNPKAYNGFKMVRKMPYLLSGDEGIQEIREMVERGNFPASERRGSLTSIDIKDEFFEKILSLVDHHSIRQLSVIADTANGMVGPILDEISKRLSIDLQVLYLEPDGNLPNHGLDPLQPENRAELQQRVVEERMDLGLAFDGDGDRFFSIDDRGGFVPGDFLTALLAEYLLEKNPGSKIIYDIRASWAVPDIIRKAGGFPLVERVGHAFIKQRMAEEKALFAGEVTGHYYFQSFFGADSGILPALLLLEMISKRGNKLSELLKPLEDKYFISGEINSRVSDPKSCLRALEEKFRDGKITKLDGLSVSYPTWHFNVRPSNTEPLLRLNLESIISRDDMKRLLEAVMVIIREYE